MSNRDFSGEDFRTESSWAGPARLLFITLVLAGGFLYYYFGPRVEDIQGTNPRASMSTRKIPITIGVDTFSIPENYTVYAKSRRAGVQDSVELYAVYPSFDGYTPGHQVDFEGNDENSPVVHFSISNPQRVAAAEGQPEGERLTEREKFERVYLPHVTDPKGQAYRYGFTHYELADSWADADEDIFVHEQGDGRIVLFRCIKNVPTMPSPWCRRDMLLSDTLAVSYRFKRARLGDWRDIDRGVTNLVKRFTTTPKPKPAPANAAQG